MTPETIRHALEVFSHCAEGERGADIEAELRRIERESANDAICYQARGWLRRIA